MIQCQFSPAILSNSIHTSSCKEERDE
uniref:Uncharacterized protein n=1 Tax=Anguilla anguilla TaxID=7936 RepID=A0A0E9TRL7_ANGAN